MLKKFGLMHYTIISFSMCHLLHTFAVKMETREFVPGVAAKLNLRPQDVTAVLQLLGEGATIPFIARYRKDKTGALDEVQIQQIQDEAAFQKEFSERKAFIEKTITEQGKMTEALQAKLNGATTIAALEDIYLPYKTKRRTKAQVARENGLEPLSVILLEQGNTDIYKLAEGFINENDLKIFTVVDSAEEAVEQIDQFYQRYAIKPNF